jgi:predicted nuclease of predicted toxin-antitoxin system
MSVGLYMDVHVRQAVTDGLRDRGVDVLTAQEDGRRELPDPDLLDRATVLGRVLFTQDDDFLQEAARRQKAGIHFAGVVYAHQLALTIGQCIEELETLAKAGQPEDFENRIEYLPL